MVVWTSPKKIIKKDLFPPLRVQQGKHIVLQRQGLPLSIIVVARLLGQMDPTHANWMNVEETELILGIVSE